MGEAGVGRQYYEIARLFKRVPMVGAVFGQIAQAQAFPVAMCHGLVMIKDAPGLHRRIVCHVRSWFFSPGRVCPQGRLHFSLWPPITLSAMSIKDPRVGWLNGAFHGGRMIGFINAFATARPGTVFGHMLGVLPEYRDAGAVLVEIPGNLREIQAVELFTSKAGNQRQSFLLLKKMSA